MNPGTIIAKHLMKDHILFHQLKSCTIKVTSSMIKAFRGVHMKYKLQHEEKKKKETSHE